MPNKMPVAVSDDLFTDIPASILTYIERRYQNALWYAFGVEDMLREDYRGTGLYPTVDPFGFAHYAARQAKDYKLERVSSLASVQDQWKVWQTTR